MSILPNVHQNKLDCFVNSLLRAGVHEGGGVCSHITSRKTIQRLPLLLPPVGLKPPKVVNSETKEVTLETKEVNSETKSVEEDPIVVS